MGKPTKRLYALPVFIETKHRFFCGVCLHQSPWDGDEDAVKEAGEKHAMEVHGYEPRVEAEP